MQEQIKIALSEQFQSAEINADILFNELQKNTEKITELLVSYHFRSRGRVFNVTINHSSIILLNAEMGKFTVNYNIGQFNACADIDFTEKASMEMLIDVREGIVTGEYIPEREPDEF